MTSETKIHSEGNSVPEKVSGTVFDTSEVELLISGASFFSVWQLPKYLEVLRASVAIHYPEVLVFQMLIIYLALAANTLLLGFALHIAVRGFWVGLLGLYSVFPKPLDWDRLNYGPIVAEYCQTRWPTIPKLIQRSDQLGSLIFSVTMAMVLIFVYSIIMVPTIGGTVFLLSRITAKELPFLEPKWLLFLFTAILLIFSLLDAYFKNHREALEKRPRLRRLLSGFYHILNLVTLGFLYGLIWNTLIGGSSKKIVYTLIGIIMAIVMCLTLMSVIPEKNLFARWSYPYFDDQNLVAMRSQHYEDRLEKSRIPVSVPFIQSDMISQKYVKLFLPYRPQWNERFSENCPDLVALKKEHRDFPAEGDHPMTIALDCLSDSYQLSLNGKPLEKLEFLFYKHPKFKLRGLLTYIAVAELPKGRNLLRVQELADPKDKEAKKPKNHYLHFWL